MPVEVTLAGPFVGAASVEQLQASVESANATSEGQQLPPKEDNTASRGQEELAEEEE